MIFQIDFDIFIKIRNNGNRICFYTEDESKFDLFMPLEANIIHAFKTKSELESLNITSYIFRNAYLSQCFRCESVMKSLHEKITTDPIPEAEEIIAKYDQIMEDLKAKYKKAFVGWDFHNSAYWIIRFLKGYAFNLITDVTEKQRKEIKNLIISMFENSLPILNVKDKLEDILEGDDNPENKAEMILRSEILRAGNMGAIERYKENGIKKVKWVTATDIRACEVCKSRHWKTYSIEEAEELLIPHPMCRCSIIPIIE